MENKIEEFEDIFLLDDEVIDKVFGSFDSEKLATVFKTCPDELKDKIFNALTNDEKVNEIKRIMEEQYYTPCPVLVIDIIRISLVNEVNLYLRKGKS